MVHWFWIKAGEVLFGGVLSLADYLSLHVLLCLIPAFFIAGAMVVFVPKEAIVKYMGKDSKRIIAYPVAAISGLLLAVCSCTVLPLFAGIKKKGAGLGPAMTFLFSAPAVNILALTYTGTLIGMDIAIARAILALVFAIVIGIIMELIFRDKKKEIISEIEENEDKVQNPQTEIKERKRINFYTIAKILLTFSVLVVGVLIAFFNKSNLQAIGVNNPPLIQTLIWGAGLILLIASFFLINNTTVNLFSGLMYLLFTGTSQINYFSISDPNEAVLPGSIEYFKSESFLVDLSNMGIKAVLSIVVGIVILVYVIRRFDKEEAKEWMRETWFFVKKIFPYLIIGVFIAGMLKELIPPEFIQNLVGKNTVVANIVGVTFGVVAYFPTLMEVPIAQMFLDLGMARGVLLAYLLADPELSIQSILVTRKFIGDKKNFVYLLLVIIFTVLAGLLFGLIVSKEPITFV
jgi:uncharacterized membrane protein YraQ (UPF0718 family)